MKPQTFQHPEIRDENDNIIQPGAFGKNTPFCTKGNDGIFDYFANDIEYLYKQGAADDKDFKAKSLAVTGTSAAPTAPTGDSSKRIANTEFVQNTVSGLVGAAPETLDTLNELATALGNDPNFATTVSNQIGKKANQTDLEELSTKVDKRFKAMIDILYPIGIVVTTATDDALKPGEADGLAQWEEIAQNRVLQGTESGAGGTIEAGLPNITGYIIGYGGRTGFGGAGGMAYLSDEQERIPSMGDIVPGNTSSLKAVLDASKSNNIYGNSSTVQPSAYKVHFWKRVS